MTHYLYKPHVTGPENAITTPDVLVDRLICWVDDKRHLLPVHRLNTATELQAAYGGLTVLPGHVVVACGGGTLLGFGMMVLLRDQPLVTADVLIARSAWRLRNVIEHFKALQLDIGAETGKTTIALSALAAEQGELEQNEDGEPVLPRGIAQFHASSQAALESMAPAGFALTLRDSERDRQLSHIIELRSVVTQRWQRWPLPRYAVGPTHEVEDYI